MPSCVRNDYFFSITTPHTLGAEEDDPQPGAHQETKGTHLNRFMQLMKILIIVRFVELKGKIWTDGVQ